MTDIGLMPATFLLLVLIINLFVPALIAAHKGYSIWPWLLYGMVPVIPLLHAMLLQQTANTALLGLEGVRVAHQTKICKPSMKERLEEGVAGIKSTVSGAPQVKIGEDMKKQRIKIRTLKNIQVYSQKGRELKFQYKCSYCGNLMPEVRTAVLQYSKTSKGRKKCNKCGTMVDWEIRTGKRR